MSSNHVSRPLRRSIALGSTRLLLLAIGVAVLVVLVDVFTKWLIDRELGPGSSRGAIQVADDFIELRYTLNGGVAFGLLDGNSTLAGVLVGVVIVPLVIVLILLASRGVWWAVAAGLVLGGAAGNLIDRIGNETVIDFISVGRWPSFNIADASITVGALVLMGLSLKGHRLPEHSDEAALL